MEERKEANKEDAGKPAAKPAVKKRIRVSIVVTVVFAAVFVLFSAAYFEVLLPALNFMYNPAPGGKGGVTELSGDPLDPDDSYHPKNNTPVLIETSPEPGSTQDPNATPGPDDPTPGGTQDPDATPAATPLIGDSGFEIEAAHYVKASSVEFEPGTRNVLLLGFDAKRILCDSIFILNINEAKKTVKIISVPRDTYVPHSITTKEALKAQNIYYSPGMFKLNAVIYIGRYVINYTGGKFNHSGIDFMCAILSKMLPGCEIDDYIYVDFDGFMALVDEIGGVEVTVPENMYTEFGELAIAEGKQKLNAKKALFYVRYRKRLDENGHDLGTGSDNWRKLNQANFIAEVATQIITYDKMNLSYFQKVMSDLKSSVYHSIDSIEKMQYYISVGTDFAAKRYRIESVVIKGYTIDPFGDKAGYSQLD